MPPVWKVVVTSVPITYHMEGTEEPYTLVFECQKGQTDDFAVGLRADTDETVAIALHYGKGTRRLTGIRLSADLKLGPNPSLAVDWGTKSRIGLPSYGIIFRSSLMNTTMGWMNAANYKLFGTAVDGYLEDTRVRKGNLRVGLTAEMTPYEHFLSTESLRSGWDWKSYWLSGYAAMKYETFDDGYFPTRGVRISLNGRYVFYGKSMWLKRVLREEESWETPVYDPGNYGEEDGLTGWTDGDEVNSPGPQMPDDYNEPATVKPYFSGLASFEAAFTIGENFTILPTVYLGYNSIENNKMHVRHAVAVGGFMAQRYVERQIPFIGFALGYRETCQYTVVPQLDLRYRFLRKNYATLRASTFNRTDDLEVFPFPVWAVGAEYSRQSIVGPLRVAVQYCDITGLTFYASIGFDF